MGLRQKLLDLLKQGLTPGGLAMSLALGCAMGLMPVLGISTWVCVALASVLRLNQPAIQVGNYAVGFPQLALILPFVRMGEWLFGEPPLPLSASQLTERLQADGWAFVKDLSGTFVHAVAAWLLCVPVVMAVMYAVLLPVCRRLTARFAAAPPG